MWSDKTCSRPQYNHSEVNKLAEINATLLSKSQPYFFWLCPPFIYMQLLSGPINLAQCFEPHVACSLCLTSTVKTAFPHCRQCQGPGMGSREVLIGAYLPWQASTETYRGATVDFKPQVPLSCDNKWDHRGELTKVNVYSPSPVWRAASSDETLRRIQIDSPLILQTVSLSLLTMLYHLVEHSGKAGGESVSIWIRSVTGRVCFCEKLSPTERALCGKVKVGGKAIGLTVHLTDSNNTQWASHCRVKLWGIIVENVSMIRQGSNQKPFCK